MRSSRAILRVASAVFCAALSGCVAFSPYGGSDQAWVNEIKGDNKGVQRRIDVAHRLLLAQQNIGMRQNEMLRRANESSAIQSTLFGIAIPAAATAGYYGITGHRGESAIASLGITAATALGISNLTQATPRQQVYIAGIDALSCLDTAASLKVFPEDYADFDKNLSAAQTAKTQIELDLAAVQTKLKTLNAHVSTWTDGGVDVSATAGPVASAEAAIADAEAAIAKAETTITNVRQTDAAVQAAPSLILAQTIAIESNVNFQLSQRQPTTAAVLSLVNGLRGDADAMIARFNPPKAEEPAGKPDPVAQFEKEPGAPAANVAALTNQRDTELQQLRAAVDKLIASTEQLAPTLGPLKSFVDKHAQAVGLPARITACTPKNTAAPTFTVDPAGPELEINPGEDKPLTLAGGSGLFETTVVGAEAGKISIIYPNNSSTPRTMPIVHADAAATAGKKFTVLIKDLQAPDVVRKLTFTVAAAAGAPAPSGSAPAPNTPPADNPGTPLGGGGGAPDPVSMFTPDALTPTQIAIAQLAFHQARPGNLRSTIDGKWGPTTDRAATAFLRNTLNRATNGSHTDVERKIRSYLAESDRNVATLIGAATRTRLQMTSADERALFAAGKPLASCNGLTLSVCFARK